MNDDCPHKYYNLPCNCVSEKMTEIQPEGTGKFKGKDDGGEVTHVIV
jgi:hypothetical protein